jgi:dipeptidyl aminopeptidase/acylaminoacyl peptidase
VAPSAAAPGKPVKAPAAATAAALVAPDVPGGAAAERDAHFARLVTPILEAFNNWDPYLTPDGREVVFTSDRDGLPQVYVSDARAPQAPARRLVVTTERAWTPTPTPDGRHVVFRSDRGGDENWSFFRVDRDGRNLIELTPGELRRRDRPRMRGATIFYSARRREAPEGELFSLPIAGGTPRRIFGERRQGWVPDVSRDGRWAVWMRRSASGNTVLVVDLETGAPRELYPRAGVAKINDAAFSPDGRRIFVATDGGGDQALVLALDRETGKEVGRWTEREPATAEIDGLLVSPRGDRIAVEINAGNRQTIRLLDARTLRSTAPVRLPLGSGWFYGSLTSFSADGRSLTLSWSTPSSPLDALVVDVVTGRVRPLRREPRPGLAGLEGITVRTTEVPSFDGMRIPVHYYLPAGAAGRRLPVIVHLHGGLAQSSKIGFYDAPVFLPLGYAWVEPNVRGSAGFGRAFEKADDGVKRLDAFRDIEAVGRWAASQPWADPQRLVIYGYSYGGYSVLIGLTRHGALWRAGVDLFGMSSLTTIFARLPAASRELWAAEFGDPSRDRAFLESISPLRDVGKVTAPLFVYAGQNDARVPRSESDQIVRALRARRVPVEYVVVANEGHTLDRRENQIAVYSRIARFLETHLAR